MKGQLTVEQVIAIHDQDAATHTYYNRKLDCTYLLKDVEVRNDGSVYANYGLLKDDGTFTGWVDELMRANGHEPSSRWMGAFLPAQGVLRHGRSPLNLSTREAS